MTAEFDIITNPEGLGIEDIPEEIIQQAVEQAVVFGECPCCGMRQFLNTVPGRVTPQSCIECGEINWVIG